MNNLTTKLMGVELKNPLVLGACSLSNHPEKLKELEEAGISAIVFKSLFEEQIMREAYELDEQLHQYDDRNAEMTNLFPVVEHSGPGEHILKLKAAVNAVNIPVFASINCVFEQTWVEYAKALAETGIAGLELNFYDTPKKLERTAKEIEDYQVRIVEAVKKATNLPVQVKLSRYYTNPLNLIERLDKAGANSFVLFNRLFLPTIDTHKEEFALSWDYTEPEERLYALRFAGLLYGKIEADIVSNTGIYTWNDVVSMILAGANSVQIVSVIYKWGWKHIPTILDRLDGWMTSKGYKSLDDFRGKLAHINIKDKTQYTRAQYVDILLKQKPLFLTEDIR
ncbi:dihydroorotate dehydrogenase-like protein [Saccharicrinis sp. FJH54]|uniref:dihydroorotate dehydrogenase-like protein n=1 Tax=Saccharicrinis sp. FJH54 TaxID=3344665 RepID=UPI0035D40DA0